jgi:hypothetical protein
VPGTLIIMPTMRDIRVRKIIVTITGMDYTPAMDYIEEFASAGSTPDKFTVRALQQPVNSSKCHSALVTV